MVVHLRSGKELSNKRTKMKEKTEQEKDEGAGRKNRKSSSELTAEIENKVQNEQPRENCEQKEKEKVQAYTPAVPFPQRLQKVKKEEQFSKFLEIFKKIEINFPFVEAITQIPNYSKFLKDILRKRKKIVDEEW